MKHDELCVGDAREGEALVAAAEGVNHAVELAQLVRGGGAPAQHHGTHVEVPIGSFVVTNKCKNVSVIHRNDHGTRVKVPMSLFVVNNGCEHVSMTYRNDGSVPCGKHGLVREEDRV